MVSPSLEKIEAPPIDVAVVSWPITGKVEIRKAYDLAYEFWSAFDKQATTPPSPKEKSPGRGRYPTYVEFKKSLIGVIAYDQEGDPYCAEDDGDLEKYSSWKTFEMDLRSICDAGDEFFGFCIGFHCLDVSLELASLRKLSRNEPFNGAAEFSIWSHYDIRGKIEEFVKITNSKCDTSNLEQLGSYRLVPLPPA